MLKPIQKIAVLGSGVMGAGIAAALAGCDRKILLLDIQTKLALDAIEKLKSAKPSPLYTKNDIQNITPGNFSSDLKKISECNWIIEVVLEKLDIKHQLYKKIEPHINKDCIISSNTSGLKLSDLKQGFSKDLQKRFFITHFFNPPRYMKLVEIISDKETDKQTIKKITDLLENKLGKGIVFAKDTPNFIANRIGIVHIMDIMNLIKENSWPIEAVDAVLSKPCSRPKSGIFRTADIVGLDTLSYVAETVIRNCPNDYMASRVKIPTYLIKMISKNYLGQKTKQGFYKKDKESGKILAINTETLEYSPVKTFSTLSLKQAKSINDSARRLESIFWANDHAGEIAWKTISRILNYSANIGEEISDDIVSIDNAMKWGFNWEFGPFEMWDILGIEKICAKFEKENQKIPILVEKLLKSNQKTFYQTKETNRFYFDFKTLDKILDQQTSNLIILKNYKENNKIVKKNSGASLIDIDDGIFVCEFTTKMNAIDADIISMINKSIDYVNKNGIGLLISNQGTNFSVGANLLLILMAAEQKKWNDIEIFIKDFQNTLQKIRFSEKPVITTPFGMVLGGGCEVCLASNIRTANIETYMGLVESGVGLLPAGCGCKNLILQIDEIIKQKQDPEDKAWHSTDGAFPKIKKAFENIAMAKVSTSAKHAKELGFLTQNDKIIPDKNKLIKDAKTILLETAKTYSPPKYRDKIFLPGEGGKMALINAINNFKLQGIATDHDFIIGEKIAHVLTGGDKPVEHKTDEQHILDLECEAFISLCGQEKTIKRIKHTLMTGKPLRN